MRIETGVGLLRTFNPDGVLPHVEYSSSPYPPLLARVQQELADHLPDDRSPMDGL